MNQANRQGFTLILQLFDKWLNKSWKEISYIKLKYPYRLPSPDVLIYQRNLISPYMAVYLLVEVAIHSPALYEEYKKKTPALVEAFGGKFVLRGLPVEALEGSWDKDRLVLLEFPNRERALAWYHSEGYQEAKQLREKASTARFLLIGE